MNHRLPRRAAMVAVVLMLAAGCGSGSDEEAAGPVMSDLAPSYDARPHAERTSGAPREKIREQRRQRLARNEKEAPHRRSSGARGVSGQQAHAGSSGAASVRDAAAGTSTPVRIEDPSGDLSRSTEGAPAWADIVAVKITRRGDAVEVQTTFSGQVPTRQTGSKGMNVASFYDVDDNGIVDYEVWTSLADNGWGTGYLDRRKEKASFGPSTGIRVSAEGDTLVTRFPGDTIGGARVFRWSAASEWGSYASMSSSTSARDYAPDEGAAGFPG